MKPKGTQKRRNSAGVFFLLLFWTGLGWAESNTVQWVNGTNFYGGSTYTVGQDGVNNRLYVFNGGVLSNGTGRIGYSTNANNNLALVWGAGSKWINQNNLIVGYRGSANLLYIAAGGWVSNNRGYIGFQESSSNNVAYVTGSGSVWSNRNNLYVGYRGDDNELTVADGGRVVSRSGYLGYNTGSDRNSATVTGAGSEWAMQNNLYVGRNGQNNRMTVSDGGRVSNTRGYIGDRAASHGNEVLVTGVGSVWSNRSHLYVGNQGDDNRLIIEKGGRVVSASGLLGYSTNSARNVAEVVGAGSKWEMEDNLTIGRGGSSNRLLIAKGGVVSNARGYVGARPTSQGNEVHVIGEDAVWLNRGNLYVGNHGKDNLVRVEKHASLISSNSYIGYQTTSSGNQVQISDAKWKAQNITVGFRGSNNQLILSNHATVSFHDASGTTRLGHNETSTKNLLRLTEESTFICPGNLIIGRKGAGNLMEVLEGSLMVNSNAYLGYYGSSDNNAALVLGTGSVWSNTSALFVGYANGATGNVVRVEKGGWLFASGAGIRSGNSMALNSGHAQISGGVSGSLPTGGNLFIGEHAGGSSIQVLNGGRLSAGRSYLGYLATADWNKASVSGIGSHWVTKEMYVGYKGSGNKISINNGGQMETARVVVGDDSGSTDNNVYVDGAGSQWNNDGELIVGKGGGVGNRWTVSHGGKTTTRTATIRKNATLHLIDGAFDAALWTLVEEGGTLSGYGQMGGAVTNAGLISVGSSATIGTLMFDAALTLTDTSTTAFTLESILSYDRIVVDDHFTFDGFLSVELSTGFDPLLGDSFDLIDWGTASGTFDGMTLPTLTGSLSWDTSELYTTGTITVVPEPAVIGLLSIGAILTLVGRRFLSVF